MEILPSLHEFIAGSPQALFHPHGAHLARLARRVAGARPRGATMLQWSGSTARLVVSQGAGLGTISKDTPSDF